MTLGAILKSYREENGLSLRDFAKKSGVSNSYLSMLETGRQPSSGRPIVPTLTKLNQIAVAMGMRVDDLIAAVDDMPVRIDENKAVAPAAVGLELSPLEVQLVTRFRALPQGERNLILRSLGLDEEKEKDGSIVQNAV